MVATAINATQLESFLVSCPEMLIITGIDGTLLQWSADFQEAVGLILQRKMRLFDLFHPDDRDTVAAIWPSMLERGRADQVECRLHDKRGGYQRVSCNLRLGANGDAVYGSLRPSSGDITGSEREELERQGQILRALKERMPICVWAVDHHGVFTYYDGNGLAAAGLAPNQFLGMNIFDIYGETAADVRRAFGGAQVHSFAKAHNVHWESWLVPVRGGDGEVTSVIGFTLDISAAKRAEEELQAKLALIEQQQAVIRDLSTPIIEVWNGVLTLPMVGVVDSLRVAEVMDSLLQRITEKNARFAILDLTGVEVVDTRVASHLLKMLGAIRLLGAEGVITGIQGTVAQTIVALGMDMSGVVTHCNLRGGLGYCIQRMAELSHQGASLGATKRSAA